jgi:uncharacterized protein YxjI
MKLSDFEWGEVDTDNGEVVYSVTATDLETGKRLYATFPVYDGESMTIVQIRNKLLGILEHEKRK